MTLKRDGAEVYGPMSLEPPASGSGEVPDDAAGQNPEPAEPTEPVAQPEEIEPIADAAHTESPARTSWRALWDIKEEPK